MADGFTRKRKTYRLAFEDPEYEGLEIRVRGISTQEYLDALDMKAAADEDSEAQRALLRMFADSLLEWNLMEEDGVTPVPATYEALAHEDLTFVDASVAAWLRANGAVSGPLDGSSTGGEPSAVASIPMAPLSPSQQSLSVPS